MNHVLIVDDEADIRDSLEAILREEDYVITTAGTAKEALELVRDAVYQAVLLDIWLPDSDGLDVLAQRVFAFQELPDKVLIDDNLAAAVKPLIRLKETTLQ